MENGILKKIIILFQAMGMVTWERLQANDSEVPLKLLSIFEEEYDD